MDAFPAQLEEYLAKNPDAKNPNRAGVPPLPPDLLDEEVIAEGEGSPIDPTILGQVGMPGMTMPSPTSAESAESAAQPKDIFERIMAAFEKPGVQFSMGLMTSDSEDFGGAFADAQKKLNDWRKNQADSKMDAAKIKKLEAETANELNPKKKIMNIIPGPDGYYAVYNDASTQKIIDKPPTGALNPDKIKGQLLVKAAALQVPDENTGGFTKRPATEAEKQAWLQENLALLLSTIPTTAAADTTATPTVTTPASPAAPSADPLGLRKR